MYNTVYKSLMAYCTDMQRCRESPILNAVLQHEEGRALLLRRYKNMLTTDKTLLQQRVAESKLALDKYHSDIAECRQSLEAQRKQLDTERDKHGKELAGCKKSLTQQQEDLRAVLEKYREVCRQKAECSLALSSEVARQEHAVDVYVRYRMSIEEFIQGLKDMLEKVVEAVGTNRDDEVILRANAQMILYALYADLCNEVLHHRVQRE